MKKIWLFFLALLLFLFPQTISAQEMDEGAIQQQVELFDFQELDNVLQNKVSETISIDFQQLLTQAMKGELNLSLQSMINSGLKVLFREIYTNVDLIKNLIIIALISSFLKNLTDSFKNKEVGELGFYISYIVLILVLFSSFRIGLGIMSSVVSDLSYVMEALLPFVMSLLFMSGEVSSAIAFNPMLIFAIGIITRMIRDFLGPLITFIAVMQIVNFLSVKEILTKLSEQLQKGIGFVLKGTGILFIAILSLQKVSVPIVNNLVTKTAKLSLNAIPVVGDVLTGAVDTVMYWTQATKSGFMVASIVGMMMVCAIPVIKLVALILVYKLTAALIQPICDERIVSCIDSIGSMTALLLGCTVTVIVMFVFYIMITLSF